MVENYLKAGNSNMKRSVVGGNPNDSLRGVFVRLGKRPTAGDARISSRSKVSEPTPERPIERYISWNYLRQHLMKRNQGYHTLSSVRL